MVRSALHYTKVQLQISPNLEMETPSPVVMSLGKSRDKQRNARPGVQQESRLGELEKHTQSLMTEQRYQSMKVQELLATLQEVSTTLQKVSTSQADFLAELASLKAETLQMEKRASAQPMRQKTVSTQPVIHLGKHEESLLQLKPMLQPEPLLQLVQPTSLQSTSIDTTKQSVQPTVNETTKQSVEDQTSAQTNQVKDGSTTQVERVSHTASFSHAWKRVTAINW